MRQTVNYDEHADIQAVEQFGYVDLTQSNAESVVTSVSDVPDEKYNGIEDPRSIGDRPRDDFEVMSAAKTIAGYKPPKQDEAENQ